MVLHIQEPCVHVTWSYLLEDLDGERTRLVLLVRTWLEIKPQMEAICAAQSISAPLFRRRPQTTITSG
jgi:hypothetical protein